MGFSRIWRLLELHLRFMANKKQILVSKFMISSKFFERTTVAGGMAKRTTEKKGSFLTTT